MSSLIRMTSGFEADLILAGHTHKLLPAKVPVLYVDHNGVKLRERLRTFARTGSFLRGYMEGSQTYVEAAGYPPTYLGWPTITLCLGKSKESNDNLAVMDVKVTV